MSGVQATYTLAELAKRFALELRGDGAVSIPDVATLAAAQSTQIGFLANPRYRGELATTQAAAVIHKDFERGFIKADTVSYSRSRWSGELRPAPTSAKQAGRSETV